MTEAEKAKRAKRGQRCDISRNVLKKKLSRVKAMFNWAVGEELVSGNVAHALRTVKAVEHHDRSVRSKQV